MNCKLWTVNCSLEFWMMKRNRGGVAQPLLAVKEKQHRQECLCYYACEPRWGSKTAVVASVAELCPESRT